MKKNGKNVVTKEPKLLTYTVDQYNSVIDVLKNPKYIDELTTKTPNNGAAYLTTTAAKSDTAKDFLLFLYEKCEFWLKETDHTLSMSSSLLQTYNVDRKCLQAIYNKEHSKPIHQKTVTSVIQSLISKWCEPYIAKNDINMLREVCVKDRKLIYCIKWKDKNLMSSQYKTNKEKENKSNNKVNKKTQPDSYEKKMNEINKKKRKKNDDDDDYKEDSDSINSQSVNQDIDDDETESDNGDTTDSEDKCEPNNHKGKEEQKEESTSNKKIKISSSLTQSSPIKQNSPTLYHSLNNIQNYNNIIFWEFIPLITRDGQFLLLHIYAPNCKKKYVELLQDRTYDGTTGLLIIRGIYQGKAKIFDSLQVIENSKLEPFIISINLKECNKWIFNKEVIQEEYGPSTYYATGIYFTFQDINSIPTYSSPNQPNASPLNATTHNIMPDQHAPLQMTENNALQPTSDDKSPHFISTNVPVFSLPPKEETLNAAQTLASL